MANLVEIQHLKHLYNIKRDYCDYFDILLHFGPNTHLNAHNVLNCGLTNNETPSAPRCSYSYRINELL